MKETEKITNKSKKKVRGEQGYINEQKRKRLMRTLLYFGIAAVIFILGLCLNKFEKSNIFTIIAVLMVLPAVRALVSFIALAPFASVAKEASQKVHGLVKGGTVIFEDMVFSSPEKIMFCAFLVVAEDEILCLAGREKEDTAYIEKYLKESLKKRQFSYRFYITKDEKQFFEKVSKANQAEEVPEEVTDFLRSLIV